MRRVYVVDDEEPIRKSASFMLKVAQFETRAFESGTALLAQADELPPGCILLDIRMPEIDGIDVLRELRRRSSPHASIVMTGHGDIQSALAALQGGAVGFIEKPFARQRLLEILDLAFVKLEDPPAYADRIREATDLLNSLNKAERDVLEGLASARSNEELANEHGLKVADLELIRARLLDQLNVQSVTTALNIAFLARQQASD